jgi:ribosomal protein L7/L12
MTRSKITATVEELLKMYRDGKTLQQIGDKFGASREAVRQYFERAGVLVMSERALTRATKNQQIKPLAEAVLIESCNRKVKEVWEEKRYAETLLRNIKKSRIDLIKGVNDTLAEIQRTCELGLKDKTQASLALKAIEGLVKKQAEDFKKYKNFMNGYGSKELR